MMKEVKKAGKEMMKDFGKVAVILSKGYYCYAK